MQTLQELFNASQFQILQCVSKLVDLNVNCQEADVYLGRINVNLLRTDVDTLGRIIDAMLDADEEGDYEEEEDSSETDEESSESSVSTSESSVSTTA